MTWGRSGSAALLACVLFHGAAASAQDLVQVPTDASFAVRAADVPRNCSPGDDGFHVRLGGTTLAAPVNSVGTFTPSNLQVTGQAGSAQMFMQLPRGAGCPGTPVEAMTLSIDPADPVLPYGVIIAAGEVGPVRQMARLRDGGCPKLDATRVGCGGSVNVGGEPVKVTAVIASARDALASDGTPLFAICEETPKGLLCEATAHRKGLTIKAVLKAGEAPSVEQMRAVYERIDAAMAAWSGA